MELLAGCGSRRTKSIRINDKSEWTDLVTLDLNPDHNPNVVWDLNVRPLPFEDDKFDEIHLYEVCEHLGQQGNFRAWFDEWSEWWRILKPSGVIVGTSPHWSSPWAWMDPGHVRAMGPEILTYLHQPAYTDQVGKTSITDYRFCYRADFDIVLCNVDDKRNFQFGLRAVKPSRIDTKD